jgi:hypothetical protein
VDSRLHGRSERAGGREHTLAEHDEREQTVAFGDVVRMPGTADTPFRPDGHGQLRGDQDEIPDDAGRFR